MKTEYEKRYVYDFNQVIFGKSKKRHYPFYVALAILVIIVGFLLS